MGVDVSLQNEEGVAVATEIYDPEERIAELLTGLPRESYPYLAGVDRYGDTTFNQLQIPSVLNELTKVKSGASDPNDIRLLEQVMRLAQRCQIESHLYLKFIGD